MKIHIEIEIIEEAISIIKQNIKDKATIKEQCRIIRRIGKEILGKI